MEDGYIFKEGDVVALKPEYNDVVTGKRIRHNPIYIVPILIEGVSNHDKTGHLNFRGYIASSLVTDEDISNVIWPEDHLMYWWAVKDEVLRAHEKLIAKLNSIQ